MEGRKVKQVIIVFDDDDTMCLETVTKEPSQEPIIEEPSSPPSSPPAPPKVRAKNIGRVEDDEKIVYTYEREKTMKNGETKKVTETRTHWKYPSVNEPRHTYLVNWVLKANTELLRSPILSQYHDYCTHCKEDNVKPFCYNVFARIVKGI